MKVFACCLVVSVFYLAVADVNNGKKKVGVATDKSNDGKSKRDASLPSSIYHGPSYKYLPPISSTYNSAGFSGGHISGLEGGYRSGNNGHIHSHQGFSSVNPNVFGPHGTASSYSGGSHSFGFPFSNHYAGQGSTKHFGSGLKGGADYHYGATLGHGEYPISRPHSYPVGHGYGGPVSSVSSLEHNLHSSIGANAASGSGYHFSKDSSGFGPVQAVSSSIESSLDGEHHVDHVHNGAQEYIYINSNVPTGNSNSHNYVSQQGNRVVATASYLPPVKQHPFPSSSHGEAILSAGDSYNTKYQSQASTNVEQGPVYAAGHKGLGYFSFMANKPNVLHTSISGSSFKQPSYSKAPFKPSTFLGAKFEGSSHNDALSQQYLPSVGAENDSAGYDYPMPSGPSINYQEPSYPQSAESNAGTVLEPDSSYLNPKNNQDSPNGIHSAPSSNYLPPSNSYGVPYSNLGKK